MWTKRRYIFLLLIMGAAVLVARVVYPAIHTSASEQFTKLEPTLRGEFKQETPPLTARAEGELTFKLYTPRIEQQCHWYQNFLGGCKLTVIDDWTLQPTPSIKSTLDVTFSTLYVLSLRPQDVDVSIGEGGHQLTVQVKSTVAALLLRTSHKYVDGCEELAKQVGKPPSVANGWACSGPSEEQLNAKLVLGRAPLSEGETALARQIETAVLKLAAQAGITPPPTVKVVFIHPKPTPRSSTS